VIEGQSSSQNCYCIKINQVSFYVLGRQLDHSSGVYIFKNENDYITIKDKRERLQL
jgi:hypothetical protein